MLPNFENVFSIFDGLSGAQIALNRSGIKYNNYYASEIDKSAIKVTQSHFPKTVQLGDVTKIKGSDLPKIDIMFAGSPCTSFSNNGHREGFDGESKLFWEFARLLKEIKPKYFFLENVVMKEEWKNIITNELQVSPILFDSAMVSAQRRKRLYWFNFPFVGYPIDKELTIKDIIYDNSWGIIDDPRKNNTKKMCKTYVQWDTSGKGYKSQNDRAYYLDGKMCTINRSCQTKLNICLDYDNNLFRVIHPIEAERLQTLEDNYTNIEGISKAQRFSMIGNGWNIDTICWLLNGLNGQLPKIPDKINPLF